MKNKAPTGKRSRLQPFVIVSFTGFFIQGDSKPHILQKKIYQFKHSCAGESTQSHTDFDERIICVVPEESIGKEGDNCIDQRHIQNPYARNTGSDDSEACTRDFIHLSLFPRISIVPYSEPTF